MSTSQNLNKKFLQIYTFKKLGVVSFWNYMNRLMMYVLGRDKKLPLSFCA